MISSCVTCGTEGDECQRVFADHGQLVFGKGQPAYDVLYKIIGDDRGHVPLQFPQHHQFPVLKDMEEHDKKKNYKKKKCQSFQIQFLGSIYSVRGLNGTVPWFHWPWRRSQSIPIPRGNGSVRRATFLLFISPRCILLSACLSHSSHPLSSYRRHVTSFAPLRGPASETASPFLPVTSLKQLTMSLQCTGSNMELTLHTVRALQHQQEWCTQVMISFPVCKVLFFSQPANSLSAFNVLSLL